MHLTVIYIHAYVAREGTCKRTFAHLLVDTLEDGRHEACIDRTTYDTVVVLELTAPWKVEFFLTLDVEDNFLAVHLESVTWVNAFLIRSDEEVNFTELTCST